MRFPTVTAVALLLSMAVPVAAQESVTLSRYRLSAFVGNGGGAQVSTVDLTKLAERCEDEDGCEITLIAGMDSTNLLLGTHGRLFKRNLDWSVDGALHANTDTVVAVALSVTLSGVGTCSFSDADDLAGSDNTDAFTVKSNASNVFSLACVLTVID